LVNIKINKYNSYFLLHNSASPVWATSLSRFLDHAYLDTHKAGRIPLNE